MIIRIEQLPKEMKKDVIRLGGYVNYYNELDECILATFYRHELKTHADHVVITDTLTGEKLTISSVDFYTIELS